MRQTGSGSVKLHKIFATEAAYLIIVATDDMHVRCNRPQIVVGFTVAYIAGAKDLLDFSWDKKLFEL